MTNEIAVQQHSVPAEIVDSNPAVAQLRQHAEMMATAHHLAKSLCASDIVPAIYKGKPDNGAAAILYGAELGLNPIQSLQQIFIVHGTPAIYARTMVALVKKHGYKLRTESSTDEAVTVVGTAPDGSTEMSTWTYDRAKKAGYTTNKKYDTDPQAMLYAKAATEVCRKLAPDVLLGIAYSREELEMDPTPVRVESQRVTAADLIGEPAAPTPAESASKVGDDSAPAPERKATGPQLKRLHTLLTKLQMTDRDSALAWISDIVGRPEGAEMASSKDLTASEIQLVFDELEKAIAEQEAAAAASGAEQPTLADGADR